VADTDSKKASTYLKAASQDERSLFAKIKALQALNQKVAAHLEPHLATYCHVVHIIGHRLIIMAANGSVATELRLQAMDLLRKFKADPDPELQRIQDIHCKVHPSLSTPAPRPLSKPRQKMQLLSPETAQLINDMAESLSDAQLKAIMKKIAGRGK
jgi:hypothetical protein